jgi:hypothetical protein
MLTTYISPERKPFCIHKKLLCNSVAAFNSIFNTGFKETSTNSADLPEDHHAASTSPSAGCTRIRCPISTRKSSAAKLRMAPSHAVACRTISVQSSMGSSHSKILPWTRSRGSTRSLSTTPILPAFGRGDIFPNARLVAVA